MLQVGVQCVKPPLLRSPFWSFSRYFEIKAYFADGVFVGAQHVAVPSKASLTKFVGNRGDTEPLTDLLVADAVCTCADELTPVIREMFQSGKSS
ncbi:hypothetical protein Y032_0129g1499 [Ancylostoma ceylanicum]|uniref:Uncharacterized protein n=1 Tax=Ancylostoma ceylanicum TaxID=53326 RepID=A0A016T6V5_9BILA|nr:hypothetical protein Y032_0129g1499 [Ancylostoma ceylanicum]